MKPPDDGRELPIYNHPLSEHTTQHWMTHSYLADAFKLAGKTRKYLTRVFTHFLSASAAFIITGQHHNTNKTFQIRRFVEKLVFHIVPR